MSAIPDAFGSTDMFAMAYAAITRGGQYEVSSCRLRTRHGGPRCRRHLVLGPADGVLVSDPWRPAFAGVHLHPAIRRPAVRRGKALGAVMRSLSVLPVALVVVLMGTQTAHAQPNDDYIATLEQHGILIINNRDRVEAIALGLAVCQHIRDGSSPMAERGILRRNSSGLTRRCGS